MEETFKIELNLVIVDWSFSLEKIPWGPIISFQPWSRVLRVEVLRYAIGRATNWVVRCVKNHIVIMVLGKLIVRGFGEDSRERVPGWESRIPQRVTTSAASFSGQEIGLSCIGDRKAQFIRAPVMIADEAMIIIGLV